MTEMHPSMSRLYKAAKQLPRPISGQSALAAALGESPQTLNNWEARGVSKRGATKIQEVLGISSTWVLAEQIPMMVASQASQPVRTERDMIRAVAVILDYLRDVTGDSIPAEKLSGVIDRAADAVESVGADRVLDGSGLAEAARMVAPAIRGR